MNIWSQLRHSKLFVRMRLGIAVFATILLTALIILSPGEEKSKLASIDETGQTSVNNLQRETPLIFTQNLGQWDSRAKFMAQQGGITAWFEQDAITLQLEKQDTEENKQGVVTRLTFAGASDTVILEGEKRQPGATNYFVGKDRQRWQSNVPGYKQILYQGLYAGVDLRVRPHQGRLEYDLLLQPGADLQEVVVQCAGADHLEIEADGSLVLQTELGPIRQKPPLTWQELPNGDRLPIACDYHLLDETSFGFSIPDLDPTLAVVIDPGLEWSTYVGGAGIDEPGSNGLVIADNGDVLYCGRTNSLDFPATAGAFETSLSGDFDVFISRWDPDLIGQEQLVWSTFIGGDSLDHAEALQIDDLGNILIAGETGSSDFPTSANAYDTTQNGKLDGFIVELDASGSNLLYGTYFGGNEDDGFRDMAFEPNRIVTLTGNTLSVNFPVTPEAYNLSLNGDTTDVFISRLDLNNNGTEQLVWSTYFGGSDDEEARSLAVDAAGIVTISGDVTSSDLPVTSDAFDSEFGGGPDFAPSDGFVAQFDPQQTGAASLLTATYLGGKGPEGYTYSAVQPNGLVTVVGTTDSEDFPLTDNAYSKVFPAFETVYVSRFDFSAAGNEQLIYSTLVSGNFFEQPQAMVVDDSGKVVVTGMTFSSGFPTTPNAFDRTINGWRDVFLFRLNPNKTGTAQLEYSTFLGSNFEEFGTVVALDAEGKFIVGGTTRSTPFPTTPGAFQGTSGADNLAFLAKIVPGPFMPKSATFLASLNGKQQVPPQISIADGRASFELSADTTTLSYDISVRKLLGDITDVLFHTAVIGSKGPVVKTIYSGAGLNKEGASFIGEWTSTDTEPLNTELVTKLLAEEIYVSVETDGLPEGEIRGQVLLTSLESIGRAVLGDFYAPLSLRAGDFRGNLIRIDPHTGAGTLVGPMDITFFNRPDEAASLAVSSLGEVFTTNSGGTSDFWRLDAATGAGTVVAQTSLFFVEAMAFDMNDRLYAHSANPRALSEIDSRTGVATLIGPVVSRMSGLAFDPTDNTLWASTARGPGITDAIFTIDITTAEATLVGQTGFGGAIPGIVFDQLGNLFALKGGGQRPNDLVAIDKETGAGTVVGQIGFSAVSSIGARMQVPAGAQIGLDARAIKVGTAKVGESVSRTITMTSYGSADLVVSAIAEPGSPFSFTEIPVLPVTIPPRDSETFRVTFTPESEGDAETNLVITSNDSNDPVLEKRLFARADIVTGVAEAASSLPVQFSLSQNYPNPFNPSTTIEYDLPESAQVKLVVYDILGREVRTLVNAEQAPGRRQVVWHGRNNAGVQVATGLYFYRIKAGDFNKTMKLMLIK